jgi:WD40 repeat protein
VSRLIPDAKIELRDSGHPTAVLATAAALNRDIGQGQQLPVQLMPYPNPSGDKIAVVVEPASGSQKGGIVVLNRTGDLIGAVSSSLAVQGAPAWSPSGRTLAYVSSGSSGPSLRLWTIGGPTVSQSFPATGAGYNWCIWSPDGAAVLCGVYGSSTPSQDWAIGRATGGAMASVHGPGLPIAWLP